MASKKTQRLLLGKEAPAEPGQREGGGARPPGHPTEAGDICCLPSAPLLDSEREGVSPCSKTQPGYKGHSPHPRGWELFYTVLQMFHAVAFSQSVPVAAPVLFPVHSTARTTATTFQGLKGCQFRVQDGVELFVWPQNVGSEPRG